ASCSARCVSSLGSPVSRAMRALSSGVGAPACLVDACLCGLGSLPKATGVNAGGRLGQDSTGSSRLGRRISRMLSTRSQTQNSRYGTVHKSLVQTNLAATRARPATISHQPIQRSSARVERITQPEQSAKLATAIHTFAKPTLANAQEKSAT